MSLRKLPKIKAFDAPFDWRLPSDALAEWDDAIRAEDGDGVISIFGPIGADIFERSDNTAKRIDAALRKIGNREITVNVNSPGGSFSDGLGIYNLLQQHPAKVTVKVMGMAGSAASLIAMAGDEIRIPRAGFIMVHNASAAVIGNKFDLAEAGDMLSEIDSAMADVYAARSGADEKTVAKWMDKNCGGGTLFRGQGAIDAGLADALLDDKEIKTDASASGGLKAAAIIDHALAAQGMTRSERRSLIAESKGGKPGAAATAMRNAGELSDYHALLLATAR